MIPFRDKNPSRSFPGITVLLIASNVAAFLFELSLGPEEIQRLFIAYGVVPLRLKLALDGQSEQVVPFAVSIFSSMFLHGGWLHLIGNVWYLWIFGDNVEDRLGHFRFLVFYLLCGTLAALSHAAFHIGSKLPTVGASGAIAGVLGAYLVLFPGARILTLVPIFYFLQVIELPAFIVLGGWFLIQLFNQALSVAAPAAFQGVAWMAHIGGFLAGMFLVPTLARPRRRGWDYR